MIKITITANAADSQAFVARVEGQLKNPREFNAALGARLVGELQKHFKARNMEPNKMAAKKTNFWNDVRSSTLLAEVSDTGARVQVGKDSNFRIHFFGGTVRPKRGKFLTIPLVKEARGTSARQYEKDTGRNLFRLRGGRVLMELNEAGDRSLISSHQATERTRNGHKVYQLGPRMRVRAVYALATEANIPKDQRALPPTEKLTAALQEEANQFVARLIAEEGAK